MPVLHAKKHFPLPFRYQRHVLGTATTTCIGRGTKVFDGDNRWLNHGFITYGECSMYSELRVSLLVQTTFPTQYPFGVQFFKILVIFHKFSLKFCLTMENPDFGDTRIDVSRQRSKLFQFRKKQLKDNNKLYDICWNWKFDQKKPWPPWPLSP